MIWKWCWQQLKGGSDGGINVLLSFTSLSVISPPSRRCASFFMSFTDVQYVGTQVQVNETEWMKRTKIVFFQHVWLLKQQMSVLKLGLAQQCYKECAVKCNWNDVHVPRWMNARLNFFFSDCWHLGHIRNGNITPCVIVCPLLKLNMETQLYVNQSASDYLAVQDHCAQ